MTKQQPESLRNEVNTIVEAEAGGLVQLLEDPMWQAIFASVGTISMFGVVLSGIWLVNTILG